MNPETLSQNYPGRLPLTSTQYRVFCMIGSGMTSREIAVQLGRAVGTVNAHRQSINQRLGFEDLDAVQAAIKWVEGLKS